MQISPLVLPAQLLRDGRGGTHASTDHAADAAGSGRRRVHFEPELAGLHSMRRVLQEALTNGDAEGGAEAAQDRRDSTKDTKLPADVETSQTQGISSAGSKASTDRPRATPLVEYTQSHGAADERRSTIQSRSENLRPSPTVPNDSAAVQDTQIGKTQDTVTDDASSSVYSHSISGTGSETGH